MPPSKTGVAGVGHVVANRPPSAIRSTHHTPREWEGWEADKQEQPALSSFQSLPARSFLVLVIDGPSVSCTAAASLTIVRFRFDKGGK